MKCRQYSNKLILVAITTIALLAMAIPLVSACDSDRESQAEAGFTAEPASGPAPLEVRFTDRSTGDITDWTWDFGDGVTSTEQNPSHIYDNAGIYMVSLTVSNSNGSDTETKAEYVVAYAVPVADFSVTPLSVMVTQEVEFADESTGAIAWEWDFNNDGTVDSTEQNPSYIYDAPGEYTVALTVIGPGGTHMTTKPYHVYPEGYALTLAVSPTGSGTTSPVVGTHVYDEGDVATITAMAATGYKFVNWSGDASGTSATTSVTMTSDKMVMANFSEMQEFTLTMAVNGEGVTSPEVGVHSIVEGTMVEITAIPAAGWKFDSWTGDVADPYVATTTVVIEADQMVTANFSEIPAVTYTLTMEVSPADSGITSPVMGTHIYYEGDVVTITATAATGYKFVNWSGDASGTSATISVTMTGDKTVIANFSEMQEFTLTMAVSPADSGSASPVVGTHTYYEGDVVTITATAATGYEFVNWSGDASGTSATTSVTMTSDKTVTANFSELQEFTLTMAISPTGSGSTSPAAGTHTYYEGDVVTITATAATGYELANWSGDASGTSATTSVTMTGDKTVTANFSELQEFTLTMVISPAGSGSTSPAVGTHTYYEGDVVTITATAATGYKFVNWSGDASGTSATTGVIMTSDKTITAAFKETIYPAVGTEWVYDVTDGAETTEWTVTVTGEETVGSVDCYVIDFSFSEPLERVMGDVIVTITGITMWMSQTTLDGVKQEVTTLVSGIPMTVYLLPTYTGEHGAPLSVGKAWSFEETGTSPLFPEPLFTTTYDVEVVAQEYVTVSAGTFNCYKIEYSVDGKVEWTEWWSADVRGTVKIVTEGTLAVMPTAELASYTPG